MADGNITVEVSTQAAQAELERLRAENAALKREAYAWWEAARDATKAERNRCAKRVALHSQYPIQTDYDRGYDKARKDAAETLRNMSAYELNPVAATPEQRALTADVFEALDLRHEQFLTNGGLVNRGKLRAALWYPHDYLPEGHWMRAADPRTGPAAEARAWLVEWRFNGTQWLYLWPSAPGGFSFTGDANRALRFARREDADAVLRWAITMDSRRGATRACGELLVTEHEWPNAEVSR